MWGERSFGGSVALALTLFFSSEARATYSVLAVDTVTRQVGVAVASCIGREFDLAEVALLDEHYGAALAQSYFYARGRDELMRQLTLGLSPEQALSNVATQAFDPLEGGIDYSYRQYSVIDFTHAPAAFTGTSSLREAAHRVLELGALRASVQGNSLSSLAVLDALETGFRAQRTTLAARLIGALSEVENTGQGDSRCAPLSADAYYVRVQGGSGIEARLMASSRQEAQVWLEELAPAQEPDPVPQTAPQTQSGCGFAPGVESAPFLLIASLLLWRRRGRVAPAR